MCRPLKIVIPISVILLLTLNGCIADLLFLEETEVVAGRSLLMDGLVEREIGVDGIAGREIAAEGIAEGRAVGSLSKAARMGITTEDINLFSRGTAEIRAGRLISADEVAFNSSLGRIKIVRSSGENPRLFVKGANEPFAEVISEQGKIRLFNNNVITLKSYVYSIESENVNIMFKPSQSFNKTVATLHKGDMVIKLGEEEGWYKVRFINGSEEMLGYINPAILVPVVLYSLGSEDKENKYNSPEAVIAKEEKQRWAYYWESLQNAKINVIEMTPQDAMNILFTDFGSLKFRRKISYSVNDWKSNVTRFLKIDYDNIPILTENNFNSKNLSILGFTKSGELLEYVQFKDEYVKLSDPLNWGPENYGEWYYIKTLNGEFGWIFTKPFGQNYSSGKLVKRCDPCTIVIANISNDSYEVIINGNHYCNMKGNATKQLTNLGEGGYEINVLQKDGYFLYPTAKSFKINIECGQTVSCRYP